ncbi:MAG: ATP-dependent helicase [Chloroflexia bacterium]
MFDLSALSPRQRDAVMAPEGPVLVTASPGSGKTTLLVGRIAFLVESLHVAPEAVLAISFSRKAVAEIRERLVRVIGPPGGRVNVRTFQSFGLGVISVYYEQLGYRHNRFTVITNGAEIRDLTTRAAARAGSKLSLDALITAVEDVRASGRQTPSPEVAAVVEEYEALLRESNALDFNSMSSLPLKLFENDPKALDACSMAFRAILIDEAQDTNERQYRLVKLLAHRHRNIMAVGDEHQSIYVFRGADGRFFMMFCRDFPELTVITLDENYRSTPEIVAFANEVLAPLDPHRRMWTRNPHSEPVRLYAATDELDEAAFVAADVERLRMSRALPSATCRCCTGCATRPSRSHLRSVSVGYRTR